VAEPGGPFGDPLLAWEGMVLVGRVARPHGVRGDVVVNPETDFVEARFAVGAPLWTHRGGLVEPLTVARSAFGGRRPVVGFRGVADVTAAEGLAGAELRIPEEALAVLPPGRFYLHQIAGCRVETSAGEWVGTVARVDGGAGTSLLVVTGPRGEVLVPFTSAMCTTVDIDGRLIRVDAPEGLLDVNVAVAKSGRRRGRRGRAEGTSTQVPS
jgi:16S rRNA processing protein RimM